MSENVKGSLLTACRHLLRPLVRILLRHGVGFGEFADAVRATYLDIAKSELIPAGRPDTDARLALLTGIHVRDVHRIRTVSFSGQEDVALDQITRILQVDLEGDGVNEVLLSAMYFKDASGELTETGYYSVVLMRKVRGNDVVTVPLISDYYVSSAPKPSDPRTYTLAEAIDLNRVGILELFVDISRREGGGAIVYRVDGQNVQEVLRAFC